MANNIVSLINPLYEAQALIQDMYNKYDKSRPSQQTINNFYNSIGDKLFAYNTIHKSLEDQKKSQTKISTFYFTFLIIIAIGFSGIFGFFLIKELIKLMRESNNLNEVVKQGIILFLVIFITTYVIIIASLSFSKFKYVTKQTFQIDLDDKKTDLSRFIKTMKVINWGNKLVIESSMPSMVQHYFDPKGISYRCNIPKSKKQCAESTPQFPLSEDIKPVQMFRQIQESDIIGQIQRLRDAITYFKKMLLKQSVVTDTTQNVNPVSDVIDKISKFLLGNYVILDTSSIADADVTSSYIKKSDCFSNCLNDDSCSSATYHDDSKTCDIKQQNNGDSIKLNYGNKNVSTLVSADKIGNLTLYTFNLNQRYKDTNFTYSDLCKENETYCIDGWFKANDPTKLNISTLLQPDSESKDEHKLSLSTQSIIDQYKSGSYVSTLQMLKHYYVNGIVKIINDAFGTGMNFDPNMINNILLNINNKLDTNLFSKVQPVIYDILSEVPNALTLSTVKTSNIQTSDKSVYISEKEFHALFVKMSSQEMCLNFAYYANELAMTSKGLKTLYDKYNYIEVVRSKNYTMYDISIAYIIIIGVLMIVYTSINDYTNSAIEIQEIQRSKDITDLEKQNKFKQIWSNMILKYSIFVAGLIVICGMMLNKRIKTKAVNDYNKQVLLKNGSAIIESSQYVINSIYDDIKNNRYGIQTGSIGLSKESKDLLKNDNILIDESLPSGEIPMEHFYDYIVLASKLNADDKLTDDPNNNVTTVYPALVACINGFDKCNILLEANDNPIPLPLLELSIWVIMILISIGVLMFMKNKIMPEAHFQKIRNASLIKRRLQKFIDVDLEDVDCMNDDENVDKDFKSIMTIVVAILILVFGIFFTNSVVSSANNFNSGLYGSELFRNSDCYPF